MQASVVPILSHVNFVSLIQLDHDAYALQVPFSAPLFSNTQPMLPPCGKTYPMLRLPIYRPTGEQDRVH